MTAARWRHDREVVEPLVKILLANVPMMDEFPRRPFVDVPPDYASEDTAGTTVWVPPNLLLTGDVRKLITECVSQRLGLGAMDVTWHETGVQPHVVFAPKPVPPSRVLWDDVIGHIRKASDTAPFVGLARRGLVIDADLEADSPHILVSAGSGGGKSVLTKLLVCQGLNRGAGAVILDYKRSSHAWARGIPGVLYARDIDEIHDALIALGAEAERRNRASDDPDIDVGPRIFLVAEEMNATIFKLVEYWAAIRDKEDPKTSPAIAGLRDVLFMGRSVRINVIAIAQMMSARAIGGPEARENFATRALTRYSTNAWKMLAPEVWPAPKKSRVVGRWQIVKGGEAFETQVTYATDDQARAWAVGGDRPLDRPPVRPSPRPFVPGSQGALALPGQGEPRLAVLGLTLRRALDQAPELAPSLEALRKASQRAGFPQPVDQDGSAHLYVLDDLREWRKRRDAVAAVR